VRLSPSLTLGRSLDKSSRAMLRAELVGRFLTDPFRQARWGAYGGGGVAAVWSEGSTGRAALVLVAGMELSRGRGWNPSVEAAAGAGLRIGLALRPARRAGR
jgi:hypothetical protein